MTKERMLVLKNIGVLRAVLEELRRPWWQRDVRGVIGLLIELRDDNRERLTDIGEGE